MKTVWKTLSDNLERISRFGAVLAEITLVSLLLLVFHEVIVRYLFDKPTLYSVEVSEYLLIILAFMAAGWVLQEDKHVNMTSFVNLLPATLQRVFAIITSIIVLLFCLVIVWQGSSASWVAFKGDYHSSSLLNVPMWIPYSFIPIGSMILALQALVRIGKLFTTPNDPDNR